jgi:hypothetical protein
MNVQVYSPAAVVLAAPLRLPGLLLFGQPYPILASKLPLSEDGRRAWETIVIE